MKRLGRVWIFRPFWQLKVVFAGLKFLFTTKAVFLSLFRRPARIFTVFDVAKLCAVQNRGITLRASVWKPRIGVQDGKIEISQTLSQQRPLETISENTRISSFWFTFYNFFNVLPLTGLKTAEKCPSSPPLVIWKGTKYHDYFDHPFLGILTLLEFQKIPIWIFFSFTL